MAKTKTSKPQAVKKEVLVEEPVKEKATPVNNWEFKDRVYFLSGENKPVARVLSCKNIYYFDEEVGYERELLLTSNQKTPFVDEMVGVQRPEHVVFRDGMLVVPKEKVVLQKLLSLYHPKRDKIYYEDKPAVWAAQEVVSIELELEAMNAAAALDIDMAEAIMRVEVGSEVSKMSSKELKRDLLVLAKKNPKMILDLIKDDNIHLRNIGIKATELGIIKISPDNRYFTWGSSDRKLLTVPFDEHPYSALAAWFKTDEGMEVLNSIEKKLK